jgi:hypothetical protein
MNKGLRQFFRRFSPWDLTPEPVQPQPGRPWLLMVTSEKRNQNYYRDLELARRFSTIWLSERFPFANYDYDLRKILAHLFPQNSPDWVWVNYHRHYTSRLIGWEALSAPVAAFVGDPEDFILPEPRFREKVNFFRQQLKPGLLVSPYPNGRSFVVRGMEDDRVPIIDCCWAVPGDIFRPLGFWRRYDIASLGSHTPGRYPFRNQVRQFLLGQRRLKFFKKIRVGSHDGPTFARALNRCRASFTCASTYGYTFAKYFEIPACGTLLFAEPTRDLEELGFRDGENFVAVTPENFATRMEHYLLKVPRSEVARLCQAGVELVHGRHTWKHRIDELLPAVARHLQQAWPAGVFRSGAQP